MSFVKIWIHAVWGTKNREPILTSELRDKICRHIRQNALAKGFYVDEVNGYTDHLHCLMSLRSDWSLAKQMQMVKGECAHWINKNVILQRKMEWADEYFAASVSENKLPVIRNYIRFQEEHHRKLSFEEEYAYFLKTFESGQG